MWSLPIAQCNLWGSGRMSTNQENRKLSGNLVSLERSGKYQGIFIPFGISQRNWVFLSTRDGKTWVVWYICRKPSLQTHTNLCSEIWELWKLQRLTKPPPLETWAQWCVAFHLHTLLLIKQTNKSSLIMSPILCNYVKSIVTSTVSHSFIFSA